MPKKENAVEAFLMAARDELMTVDAEETLDRKIKRLWMSLDHLIEAMDSMRTEIDCLEFINRSLKIDGYRHPETEEELNRFETITGARP